MAVTTVTRPEIIVTDPKMESSLKHDSKKIKQYLQQVTPEDVQKVDVVEFPSGEWKFCRPGTQNPITYTDGSGVVHECTYREALNWYKNPSPTTGPLNPDTIQQEVNGINARVLTLEERVAQNEARNRRRITILYIIVGILFLAGLLLGFFLGTLRSENQQLAAQNEKLSNQITLLQKPKEPVGKTEWAVLQTSADTNTQDHTLVGQKTIYPLLVTGKDLQLTWVEGDSTYQVKNRTNDFGAVIIPQGAKIKILNMRGPARKVYIAPDLQKGITYLSTHKPAGYYFEDYSGIQWPTP
jgi:hypothetical protein